MVQRAILLAAVLIAGSTGQASARSPTPMDFLEKLLGSSARAVGEAIRPKHIAAKPPDTGDSETEGPVVPMPRLRASEVANYNSAVGKAPSDAAVPTAPLIPPPKLTPFVAVPTMESFLRQSAREAVVPPGSTRAAFVPAPIPAPQPRTTIASLSPDIPPPAKPPPAADGVYAVTLARLGVESSPLAQISDGDCGVEAPVAISGLEGGTVDFIPKAIISADLAETIAGFVATEVQPAAIGNFGNRVTALRIAASYACRTRDYIKGAKLSEHAFGNAIDISAFKVNGRWIEVKTEWGGIGPEGIFLKQVRSAACGPFTTVLGPGSDSFHTDHFHLDRAKRRTAGPSRGLYCK